MQAVPGEAARREHDGLRSRLVVAALCYAQPLVRSWQRYRTWLFAFPRPGDGPPDPVEGPPEPVPLTGRRTVEYWSEEWRDRTELLNAVVAYLTEHRWGRAIDSGWSGWDLEVSGRPVHGGPGGARPRRSTAAGGG